MRTRGLPNAHAVYFPYLREWCLSIDVLKHRASVGPVEPKDAPTFSISPWPTVFCSCNFVLFETF